MYSQPHILYYGNNNFKIGRQIGTTNNLPHYDYWSEIHGWCNFGDVYRTKEEAEARLKRLISGENPKSDLTKTDDWNYKQEEGWLKKVLSDAKEYYSERPDWSKKTVPYNGPDKQTFNLLSAQISVLKRQNRELQKNNEEINAKYETLLKCIEKINKRNEELEEKMDFSKPFINEYESIIKLTKRIEELEQREKELKNPLQPVYWSTLPVDVRNSIMRFNELKNLKYTGAKIINHSGIDKFEKYIILNLKIPYQNNIEVSGKLGDIKILK